MYKKRENKGRSLQERAIVKGDITKEGHHGGGSGIEEDFTFPEGMSALRSSHEAAWNPLDTA